MNLDVVLLCLTLNVYFEARGEPLAGQRAVAEVTLRRAQISGRGVCEEVFTDRQFSWTLSERPLVRDKTAWDAARRVAANVLTLPTNESRGATHFFNPSVANPKWHRSMCRTAVIGKHAFYKACR